VALGEAEIEAIAANTEKRVKTAMEEATREAARRLADVLQKMTAALSDPNQTFRDTLVGNVRNLCEVLKRLNVADDPNLERMRQQAELLAMSEPDTIRQNDNVRVETAARAQSILDDMLGTFGKGLLG
jgi:DNA topoisomerase VI subunit B